MNKLPLWKLRAASWLPTLVLTGALSVLVFCDGRASEAQPTDLETAQTDSIVDAFYLLQFDFKVAEARHLARAQMDSLRIVDINAQLQESRKQRYRDMAVFGISVVTAGLIFYLGGRAAR